MININLVRNQVPTEIDIPHKYKRFKTVLFIIILGTAVTITIAAILIYNKVQKKPLANKTEAVKEKKQNIKKQEQINHKQVQQIKKEKVKHKEAALKKKTKTNEKIKIMQQPKKNKVVFTILFRLKDIPKPIEKKVNMALPLPKQLELNKKPIHNKKTTAKNATNAIYEIRIKTTKRKILKDILSKFKIEKVSEMAKPISTVTTFDVYVGGLYDYKKTLKFSYMLKKKGYRIYKIKEINSAYYILIDKKIDKAKKEAYEQAWKQTPFKIYFKATKKKKMIYVFDFSTPNKKLIKTLKKYGFSPIIRIVKNGA